MPEPDGGATSVIAPDATSDRIRWHFGGVRHDPRDHDAPARPSLVAPTVDGATVKALVQKPCAPLPSGRKRCTVAFGEIAPFPSERQAMHTRSEPAATVDPTPSPALANTRRDAMPKARVTAGTAPVGAPFEQVLQSAWRRAARRGFSPGQEREHLLEAEFRSASGRTASTDGRE